jgi:hypothetical protein
MREQDEPKGGKALIEKNVAKFEASDATATSSGLAPLWNGLCFTNRMLKLAPEWKPDY